MTPREADILAFIGRFQRANNGASPSIVEIAAAQGLKGKSSVHACLVSLDRQGRIRRDRGRARAIHIVPPVPTLPEATDADLLAEVALRGLVVLPY